MRIRIVQKPTRAYIDGIQLDNFEEGDQLEVGSRLGALMLAEGWAEPVSFDEPLLPTPPTEKARGIKPGQGPDPTHLARHNDAPDLNRDTPHTAPLKHQCRTRSPRRNRRRTK
jgi:hypothetical protein